MKENDITKLLTEKDFHIDPLGRMVIDNPKILEEIGGSMGNLGSFEESLVDAGCTNSGC